MRPFRFAVHLREFGWDPVVLTIATPGQRLTDKESTLLEDIEILELSSPIDRTSRSESHLGSASSKTVWGDGILKKLEHQFPTDTWMLLFLARYREMVKIVERVQPDVIWCTGDPWSGVVIAGRLAERFAIPWAADFRDPWTLFEIRRKRQWRLTAMIEGHFERKVLLSADAVVFQTRSVERAYREHFRDLQFDSRTITNSFDESLLGALGPQRALAGNAAAGPLKIGFFGRFRETSPASIVIDALREVRQRSDDLAKDILVYSFGPLNRADATYALSAGVLDRFRKHEAVTAEEALRVLRTFDLLLVSTDTSRSRIIPAKLFDYLPSGRPILSLSRNPEVAEILDRTGTGVQIDPLDTAAVADFLLEGIRARRAGGKLPVRFEPQADEIGRFEARRTTAKLAELFNDLVQRRQGSPRGDEKFGFPS